VASRRRAVLGTLVLLAIAMLAWLAARHPLSRAAARAAWPELLAGAGIVWLLLLPAAGVGQVLVVAGLTCRAVWMLWQLLGRRPAPAPSVGTPRAGSTQQVTEQGTSAPC
jgi:hypothetical protein